MLVLCIIIGAQMGLAGIVCSFVERIENMDDNITVPAVSLAILVGAYYCFPSFTASFYLSFRMNIERIRLFS